MEQSNEMQKKYNKLSPKQQIKYNEMKQLYGLSFERLFSTLFLFQNTDEFETLKINSLLLHGASGTGKTSLFLNLIQNFDFQAISIPITMQLPFHLLSSPTKTICKLLKILITILRSKIILK